MPSNIVLLTEINTAGFGDYIFLILVIVASVVQAIVQQRKKQRLKQMEDNGEQYNHEEPKRQREVYNPMDEQREDPFGTLFDHMEEMFDPVQYPSNEPEPQMEPSYDTGKPEIDQKKVEEILKKAQATKMPGDITAPSVYHKEKKDSLRKNIRRDFDPRKAVIYSEIINRKY
ncbi:hypothetical protein PbJCM13498_12670 [Prolixibacter bellariivorans]|uniref:Uncharacterized protein n=1 Tax=Prolixibacter bellariivorans TaxID=314319 RepID=A0A5M4AXB4_9BACT|nr:hypothetical protein [Prolixibacter bellariivorans]GET32404.1 hypothetical protein PbJCM13498_12670 [Prolixibacter bellariivorans]